jgi:nucleoside-diphosphate-sugar epimerase
MGDRLTAGGAICLVTGGSGLLGSHIAERLIARGDRVRILARPGSATGFVEALGAERIQGNLTDPAACARAVQGVEIVYHAAAKVGDWGPWREFQVHCIDATRNLAEASAAAGLRRFLHISSTSAYGHPVDPGRPIDESTPLGQNVWVWDPYTHSKVESERTLWALADSGRLPLTVIRPSWLYGERDRTTVARIVNRIQRGKMRIIGRGDNPISAIYAGNVADAAILAANDDASVGEAYNVTNQGRITQREFLGYFASACGVPARFRRVSYPTAYAVSFLLEAHGRLTHRVRPPLISRYATWLMGRYLEYSTQKIQSRLGWQPRVSYEESITRAVRWYLKDCAARSRA